MDDVTVIGAGILGLACARALALAGARVTVRDAGAEVATASRAAAGMCAPESEALLHPPQDPSEVALWRAGLAAWEAFGASAPDGGGLDPLVRGTDLHRGGDVLHLPGERLVDPVQAMARLRADARDAGARFETGLAAPDNQSGAAVLAAGTGTAALADWAPEAGLVTPVRGQLIEIARPPGFPDRIVRAPGVYLAPRGGRLVVGATSEPGAADMRPRADQAGALLAQAALLHPGLARAPVLAARVGLRPATPFGALIGPSVTPGVFLATGAHRNGVLVALIAGEIIAAAVAGRPHPLAHLVDPRRIAGRNAA